MRRRQPTAAAARRRRRRPLPGSPRLPAAAAPPLQGGQQSPGGSRGGVRRSADAGQSSWHTVAAGAGRRSGSARCHCRARVHHLAGGVAAGAAASALEARSQAGGAGVMDGALHERHQLLYHAASERQWRGGVMRSCNIAGAAAPPPHPLHRRQARRPPLCIHEAGPMAHGGARYGVNNQHRRQLKDLGGR